MLATLVVIAFLGLIARLYRLGYRVFYYDEAWFGYWTLRAIETGAWEYRPILHGPFYARVNGPLFQVLGATDATARLVPAVLGALLPLTAWLFRDHLRDREVLALGVVLAANPILLYYSRFMRKDVPLAAFALLALGLAVRYRATDRSRYLLGAGGALGLAFTTKESVLLWLVAWAGAVGVLLGEELVRTWVQQGLDAVPDRARTLGRRATSELQRSWRPILGALGCWLLVVTFFYAPRGEAAAGPGFWEAITGDFGAIPGLVLASTVEAARAAIAYWALGDIQTHPYLPYLQDTIRTLRAGALGVCTLAAVGFVHEWLTRERPRRLVTFNAAVGVAAVVGYPYANTLPVPWSTIHAIVPLAFPAAVGAVVVFGWALGRRDPETRRTARRRLGWVSTVLSLDAVGRWIAPSRSGSTRDGTDGEGGGTDPFLEWFAGDAPGTIREVGATFLLVFLLGTMGFAAVQTSYLAPHAGPMSTGGSEIVYDAQAPGELRTGVTAIRRAATTGGDDVDVLYVGPNVSMAERRADRPPETAAWYRRMPLPWYTEAAGADVRSVPNASAVSEPVPPVVVVQPEVARGVASRLPSSYDRRRYALGGFGLRDVVFFTAPSVRGSD